MAQLSIILPIYNEEKNIPIIYHALCQVVQALPYQTEFIFVDDGSRDTSWQVIRTIAQQDLRVKGISFSRNFGQQIALTAGYNKAQGDIIISMDADMQHPPALIPQLIKKWEEGAHIVYARRIDRQENFLKKTAAFMYCRILEAIADISIPRHVAEYRLIDKKVLKEIQRSKERSRYLRGLIAWTGFKSEFVDFKTNERLNGKTGYTWKKMMRLAFDGITGFSTFPLKIAAYFGVFIIFTGSLMLTYITYDAVINHVRYPLFKWLCTAIYIFMGVQFILLWLLGEYIGRIFDQLLNRPLYIIDDEI